MGEEKIIRSIDYWNEKRKLYVCTYCNFTCSRNCDFITHLLNKHMKELPNYGTDG